MYQKVLFFSLLCSLLLASNIDEYKEQQLRLFEAHKNEYRLYKTSENEQFETYIQAQEDAYNRYKKSLSDIWSEPKLTTKKSLVTYSEDKKTRTIIDFEHNKLQVETLSSSAKEAKQKLKQTLKQAVTMDTKTFQEHDPLEQELIKIQKNFGIADEKMKADPILSNVVFSEKPTKKSLDNYIKYNTKEKNIKSVKSKKLDFSNIYTLNIELPKDTMLKRSKIYYKDVQKESKRQNIPIPLIYAIIHSESSFNPMARSYVPAYGLMQIVPKTAGVDAYYHLYRERKIVNGRYLYNSANNIRMGSAYLHILYYNYLKDITNKESRLYCTITAYNTGAGNVARAFTNSNNVHDAAKIINRMSPQEVYARLLKNLKYEEPKRYLVKVSQRMHSYAKVYKN